VSEGLREALRLHTDAKTRARSRSVSPHLTLSTPSRGDTDTSVARC
jgi:hypothetical protein